jgi:NADPH:quinone reductase
MKALLCKAWGLPDTLVVEDVADPVAGPGQAVVRVHAAGVNFPDALIIQNKYQFTPALPFVPGSECAGVVEQVGEGVMQVKPGDRVIALTASGAFAERVLADAAALTPLPAEVDFATGSAFLLTYGTAYHALADRGALKPGETLLVLGAAGGVGLTAIEIGKIMGARVIACASSDEKLALCRQYGADALINYASADLREQVRELTGGKGVDVVYDPVGGAYAEPAVRSLGFDGRYLVIGFASGDIPRIPLNLLLLKVASLVGVFWGAFAKAQPERSAANLTELFDWYAHGRLRPHVSATFPLADYGKALDTVMNRRVKGKVVLVVD